MASKRPTKRKGPRSVQQSSTSTQKEKDDKPNKQPEEKGQSRNLYQILQVDQSAEPVVIHTAYVYLMNKYISDEERYGFRLAWEVLRDDSRRARYDASLPQTGGTTHKPNLYQLLGVDAKAETSIITLAYRYLAAMNDPENGGDRKVVSQLTRAWKLLCNEKRRAAYDAKLKFGPVTR